MADGVPGAMIVPISRAGAPVIPIGGVERAFPSLESRRYAPSRASNWQKEGGVSVA